MDNNNELKIIKSERFGTVQADIYTKDNEMFMTINQLAECLEYANGRKGIENIISRNEHLESNEFSVALKMRATDGKYYYTRVFNEDGIYEVTMLSGQPKAIEFRAWIRKILKALRKKEVVLIPMSEYQRMTAEAKLKNANVRKARVLMQLAKEYKGESYSQVLSSYASKELTGEHIIPLPNQTERKTYSATEIGSMLGITAHKVGQLANKHNLKTEEFGFYANDKSRYSTKEVQSFA